MTYDFIFQSVLIRDISAIQRRYKVSSELMIYHMKVTAPPVESFVNCVWCCLRFSALTLVRVQLLLNIITNASSLPYHDGRNTSKLKRNKLHKASPNYKKLPQILSTILILDTVLKYCW